MTKDWKDKRIEAINRVCARKNLTCSPDSPYFDEVIDIYNSKAESLEDFKLERKKKHEADKNIFDAILSKLHL